ncbi:helicase-related protein, partial [Vibrio natriegens]
GYIESAGRCFPVAYRYQRLTDNSHWLDEAAKAILRLLAQEPGSMLVFLPGAGEIRRLTEQLAHSLATQAGSVKEVELCPLYGQLSPAQQQQAISPAPPGKRKVVLATNIAETSLTIEGIRLVVDAG